MWRLLPLLLLAACVTQKPVSLPNGSQGYAIDCSAGRRDISDCMNRAAELCGGRYAIITQEGSVIPVGANQIGNTTLIANVVKRVLVVECVR